MTYGVYLVLFLLLPIGLLSGLLYRDQQLHKQFPATLQGGAPQVVLLAMILVAIVYTTPWDNHLIASHVWTYNPALISGLMFGWVPIEEMSFFALQPILVGLWLFWLAHRLPISPYVPRGAPLRPVSVIVAGSLWIIGMALLLARWRQGTYLGWELAWALPPIMLQLGVAADILWQQRRLLLWGITPVLVYLSATDSLAIHLGIWTINPHQSLAVFIGGQLPVEEFVFFLLTTTLVTFGLVLGMTPATRQRFNFSRSHHALS